jgi:hypothetical protein
MGVFLTSAGGNPGLSTPFLKLGLKPDGIEVFFFGEVALS